MTSLTPHVPLVKWQVILEPPIGEPPSNTTPPVCGAKRDLCEEKLM